MNIVVKSKLDTLKELCIRYHVKRLELFGSGAFSEDFDAKNSDLDFLVEFQPLKEGEYFDTYFGLLEELQDLFERHIDLVMTRAIKNKYFLQSVNKSRAVLYAA